MKSWTRRRAMNRSGRTSIWSSTADEAASRRAGISVEHGAEQQGPPGHCGSGASVRRPPRARGAGPRRGVELHQPVHAVWAAPGLPGTSSSVSSPSAIPRRCRFTTASKRSSASLPRFMKVRAVWRFFEAEREGNTIRLFEASQGEPVHAFHFGRQPMPNGLCLSDYVLAGEGFRPRFHRASGRHCGRGNSPALGGSQGVRAIFSRPMRCRHWPSKLPKARPNGFTAASGRTGASLIRQS